MEMNIAVAGTVVAAGRTQKWFDGLTKKEQKDYLAKRPNSKFAKKRKTVAGKTVDRAPSVTSLEKRRREIRKAIESHDRKEEGGRGKALTKPELAKLSREDNRLMRTITQMDSEKYKGKSTKKALPRGTGRPGPAPTKTGRDASRHVKDIKMKIGK